MRGIALLLVALIVSGCKGAEGPIGPQGIPGQAGAAGAPGAPGPEGPGGSGEHTGVSGVLNSEGAATRELPKEVGTMDAPPAISCYESIPETTNWVLIGGTEPHTAQCGLGSFSDGHLYAWISGATPYASYMITIIY